MDKKRFFILYLFLHLSVLCAQEEKRFSLGFAYGYGTQLRDRDFTYTNRFYKIQLGYLLKTARYFTYEVILQPEVNFGEHQLLNMYFVQPDEPDYEAQRERFTKLKDIHDYILNVGVVVRKPISKTFSVYILGSVGPMITDTETERLSKGFAFSDVIAVGLAFKVRKFSFDLRPSLRHVSNGGSQGSNAGVNTKNIEFAFSFLL
nr:acyloxyacyl hydrolase [uncultured Flavobacterium sp.]